MQPRWVYLLTSLAVIMPLFFLLVVMTGQAGCSERPISLSERGRFFTASHVECVGFSSGEAMLAAGTRGRGTAANEMWTGLVYVWDLRTKREIKRLELDRWVNCLAFSPDGKMLAVGTGCYRQSAATPRPAETVNHPPGELIIYDVVDFTVAAKIQMEKGGVWELAFSPDGKVMAFLSGERPGIDSLPKEQILTLFSLENLKTIARVSEPQNSFQSIAFSPNSMYLAVADTLTERRVTSDIVEVFDSKTAKHHNTLIAAPPEMIGPSWFPNNGKESVVAMTAHGTFVDYWHPSTGRAITAKSSGRGRLAVARNARWLASLNNFEGQPRYAVIDVFESPNGKRVARMRVDDRKFSSMVFSSNGELLATGGADRYGGPGRPGHVMVWELPK